MDLAAKIKAAREGAGWSKGKLARESGLSQPYIGQLEAGQKRPTVEALSRICRALDISLPSFLSDVTRDVSEAIPELRESIAPYCSDLPPDLRRILQATRRLTSRQRKLILEVMEEWVHLNKP